MTLPLMPTEGLAVLNRMSARAGLVIGLVGLQTADLIFTYLLLCGGGRADIYEANPVANAILTSGGWTAMVGFKLMTTVVAVFALLIVARYRPAAAARLLAGFCLLMLGVNGYSISLLASSDAGEAAERLAERHGEDLDRQASDWHRFVARRTEILDAVLDGGCDTTEALERLTSLILTQRPSPCLPQVGRLPAPSQSSEMLVYLNYYLHLRADVRGLADRFPPDVRVTFRDLYSPPWITTSSSQSGH